MVCVAQQNTAGQIGYFLRRLGFDGAVSPDRHEEWSVDLAMTGFQYADAGRRFGTGFLKCK